MMARKSIYVPQFDEQTREQVLAFVREHYTLEDVLRSCPNSVTYAFQIPYNIKMYGGHQEVRNGGPLQEVEMDIRDNQDAEEVRREAEYYRNLTDILKASLEQRGKFIQQLLRAETVDEVERLSEDYTAFDKGVSVSETNERPRAHAREDAEHG